MAESISGTNFGIKQDGTSFRMTTKPMGIDSTELIDALVKVKSIPIDTNKERISKNTDKLAALATLETKIKTLNDKLEPLRKPNILSGKDDVFNYKQSSAPGAQGYLTATPSQTAAIATHQVTVNRIATSDIINSSGTFGATSAQPITVDGNLTLPKRDGSGNLNIALTTAMTLEDIAFNINDQTDQTGVQAFLIKENDAGTQYTLSLQTASSTAKPVATGWKMDVSSSSAQLLTDLGLSNSVTSATTLKAELVYQGRTVTRESNNISDLIPNVNLDLVQANPGVPISIKIEPDHAAVKNQITAWVTAYNDFIDFYKEQTKIDADGIPDEKALLYNNSTLKSLYRDMAQGFVTDLKGADSDNFDSLADLGIVLDAGRKLQVDDMVIDEAIINNFSKVSDLFGLTFKYSSASINLVNRPDNLPASLRGSTVTVRVTATDVSGVATAAEFEATIDGVLTTSPVTIDNGFLKGGSGTVFADFIVSYSGGVVSGAPFTATFTAVRGIADEQVSGIFKPVLDTLGNNGFLAVEKDNLTKNSEKLKEQNTKIQSFVDEFKKREIVKFQHAEEKVFALQQMRNYLKAYMDAFRAAQSG